jgi:hypothetical protein
VMVSVPLDIFAPPMKSRHMATSAISYLAESFMELGACPSAQLMLPTEALLAAVADQSKIEAIFFTSLWHKKAPPKRGCWSVFKRC